MFSNHVSNLFSAYCHDELSPQESHRVAEHLLSCRRCRGEFEEVKFGIVLAQRLLVVPAPDSLWPGIEKLANRVGEAAPDRVPSGSYLWRPAFAGIAAILV